MLATHKQGLSQHNLLAIEQIELAISTITSPFVDQLADPGRLLIPVGTKDAQDLILVRKEGGLVTEEAVEKGCTFVPLLGRFAWKEEQQGEVE